MVWNSEINVSKGTKLGGAIFNKLPNGLFGTNGSETLHISGFNWISHFYNGCII